MQALVLAGVPLIDAEILFKGSGPPLCSQPMEIKLVEPHPTMYNKEKHTFECGDLASCLFPAGSLNACGVFFRQAASKCGQLVW
jgi:hypothetical protein